MLSKIILVIIATLFLLLVGFYFLTNSSYQDSFEARFYYFVGNYEKAYALSKKAYDKDPYNKMAFTVLTQSKIATQYLKFIERGKEYFDKIDKISSKKEYSDADKARVKMMCEIMLEDYKKLKVTKLTDIDLVDDAKRLRDKFKQLYEQLF